MDSKLHPILEAPHLQKRSIEQLRKSSFWLSVNPSKSRIESLNLRASFSGQFRGIIYGVYWGII